MTHQQLIHTIQTYQPDANTGLLAQAYEFSERMHQGQKRRSGEPYFSHPVEVAKILTTMKLDVPTVITGLLHDTVEDTLTTLEEVEQQFGTEVAGLVDGVTKISQIHFTTREERQAENFRKMILAMGRDIRVVLVKLADRAHNMRTLSYLSPDKQREIAGETLDIYAPLAHRLGIYWLKSELEDNALRHLHPEVYKQLKRNIAKKKNRAGSLYRRGHQHSARQARPRPDPGSGFTAGPSTSTPSIKRWSPRTCCLIRFTIWSRSASSSIQSASVTAPWALCTATGGRFPAASKTTSPCPRRTCINPCTPP